MQNLTKNSIGATSENNKKMIKIERTKNTKRNITSGLINRIINILLPFLLRTIIIRKLGVGYLGVNSLFSSILSVLSLAELGFDSAVVFIMYEGVAKNDRELLNSLLGYLKKVYYVVGLVILCAGILCMPILHVLIKDLHSVPKEINIYVVYFIFLLNVVISYFFGSYKNSIINAYQRRDIVNNIDSIVKFLSFCIQSSILLFYRNYYFYIITMLFFTLLTNGLTILITNNIFQDVSPKGSLSKDNKARLNKLIKGTFLSKLGGVLAHSFDDIVISSMIGLVVLAFYSNYSYIATAIQGIVMIIYTSLQGGIGNSLVLDSVEKNREDMECFTFLFNWIVGWCYLCLLFLYQPFITLWIGKESCLPNIVMIFVAINFYMCLEGAMFDLYKTGLGIWWEDRYRTIIAASINFILSIICVLCLRKYGDEYALVGILLASIVTHIFISMPWALVVTFRKYFCSGLKKYSFHLILYFLVPSLIAILCYPIFSLLPVETGNRGVLYFIIRCIICIFLPNILYVIFFHRTAIFQSTKRFIVNHFNLQIIFGGKSE